MQQRRKKKKEAPDLGYKRGLEETYELGKEIGRGGNGVVRLVRHRASGRSFAVKSIPKVLTDPSASERKRASQIPYLRREVEVLLALRGTLNVANLEAVYEDDIHVHLVLEHCSGGELLSRTRGGRHYSERTAASFLRAVLRTVAQCHAKRIIHRDVKPENFLFLSDDEAAPLKGVDFGLAVFFDPQQLPVTGLNPEGTPWYLAPECCRAKWHPRSDVWAVGVMACYLLTGAYPFLDRVCPEMPDLARTLRSICFEELDLSRKEFAGLSEQARAFITTLLVKDPQQRPSAEEALRHPFLASNSKSVAAERAAGAPLGRTVVSRIQRFAQSSLFKRTVLEHIAADLLAMHFTPEPSVHGASVFRDRSVRGGQALRAAERSVHGGSMFGGNGSVRNGSLFGGNGSVRNGSMFGGNGSAHNGSVRNGGSVHGGGSVRGGSAFAGATADRSAHGGDRFRGMTLAAMAAIRFERSVRGGSAYFTGSREGSRHGGADRSAHSREPSARNGEREGSRRGAPPPAMHRVGSARLLSANVLCLDSAARSASQYLPVATPYSHRLAQLFDQLQLKPGQKLDRAALQKGLEQIGYHLAESEVSELFGVVDVQQRGVVGRAELAAGLIDWKAFEDTYKDRWLACARSVFAQLDVDGSGELSAAEIASAFGSHLAPYEVDAAVHQALLEATGAPQQSAPGGGSSATAAAGGEAAAAAAAADGALAAAPEPAAKLDFDHFLALLREPSGDIDKQLYKFDDRLSAHTSRQASLRADELPAVGGPRCCTIM
ncbi:calcium-dependent kinase 17-like [Chlorella sorokiniana]|uniref:Calcium-dependent kinase 17-like n=1 Tax=Chlorella sorokiniana TaxID=3076 RepID=A0A2P6TGK8_CHLSO|nr:calcium-dependent kinase 17-like [Chlorella sorokiniana]|eukprot:PRW33251.1 calcium-dependent kinase 17-like [Chlorella sorokiniana]